MHSPKTLLRYFCLLALPFGLISTACQEEDTPPPSTAEGDYPGAVADAMCSTLFSCVCPASPWESQTDCFANYLQANLAKQGEALAIQLWYDGTCAYQEAQSWWDLGCGQPPEPGEFCQRPCQVYHGAVPVGGQCNAIAGGWSACAQGLYCDGAPGICVDPCEGMGGSGLPGVGEPCPEYQCDPATAACDFTSDPMNPVCVPLPVAGQPCNNGACAEGAVCDTLQTPPLCVADTLPGPGEACPDLVCDTSLSCIDGTCLVLPGPGAPCLQGTLCNQDAFCDVDTGICQQAPGAICGI